MNEKLEMAKKFLI